MVKVVDRKILGTALYGAAGRKIHRAFKTHSNGNFTGVWVMCRLRFSNGHSFIRLGEGPAVTCVDCGPWRKGIEVETETEWENGL